MGDGPFIVVVPIAEHDDTSGRQDEAVDWNLVTGHHLESSLMASGSKLATARRCLYSSPNALYPTGIPTAPY